MNLTTSASTRSVTIIRWVARIMGLFFIALFLFFFVADCLQKGRIAVGSDRILMTVFLYLAFIGLGIAWRWEGIGATGALASLLCYNIFAPSTVAKAGIFAVTALYGLPALLFLYCWFRTRKPIHPNAI